MPVHANNRSLADLGLTVLVLMPMDDQFWLGPVDVVGQCVEALVDAVLTVKDAARRV